MRGYRSVQARGLGHPPRGCAASVNVLAGFTGKRATGITFRCTPCVHSVATLVAPTKGRPADTRFIEPESPWQNGHNESINGALRDGCLNRCAFASAREAGLIVERWRQG